jgi:hypothetical protein
VHQAKLVVPGGRAQGAAGVSRGAGWAAEPACAQDGYPSKPVKIISDSAPGSAGDRRLPQLPLAAHEGFHLGGGPTKCRALPWSNPLFIVLGEPQIEVFIPIGFTAIKMQRISNKRLPLVDIRSTPGLSPRLIPPPLPIVPCYCSPCFLPAGTGTASGLYWVGHDAA